MRIPWPGMQFAQLSRHLLDSDAPTAEQVAAADGTTAAALIGLPDLAPRALDALADGRQLPGMLTVADRGLFDDWLNSTSIGNLRVTSVERGDTGTVYVPGDWVSGRVWKTIAKQTLAASRIGDRQQIVIFGPGSPVLLAEALQQAMTSEISEILDGRAVWVFPNSSAPTSGKRRTGWPQGVRAWAASAGPTGQLNHIDVTCQVGNFGVSLVCPIVSGNGLTSTHGPARLDMFIAVCDQLRALNLGEQSPSVDLLGSWQQAALNARAEIAIRTTRTGAKQAQQVKIDQARAEEEKLLAQLTAVRQRIEQFTALRTLPPVDVWASQLTAAVGPNPAVKSIGLEGNDGDVCIRLELWPYVDPSGRPSKQLTAVGTTSVRIDVDPNGAPRKTQIKTQPFAPVRGWSQPLTLTDPLGTRDNTVNLGDRQQAADFLDGMIAAMPKELIRLTVGRARGVGWLVPADHQTGWIAETDPVSDLGLLID